MRRATRARPMQLDGAGKAGSPHPAMYQPVPPSFRSHRVPSSGRNDGVLLSPFPGLTGGLTGKAAKNPALAGFFEATAMKRGSGGLERLDAGGQAALVAGGPVLVGDGARAGAVERRSGAGEGPIGPGRAACGGA